MNNKLVVIAILVAIGALGAFVMYQKKLHGKVMQINGSVLRLNSVIQANQSVVLALQDKMLNMAHDVPRLQGPSTLNELDDTQSVSSGTYSDESNDSESPDMLCIESFSNHKPFNINFTEIIGRLTKDSVPENVHAATDDIVTAPGPRIVEIHSEAKPSPSRSSSRVDTPKLAPQEQTSARSAGTPPTTIPAPHFSSMKVKELRALAAAANIETMVDKRLKTKAELVSELLALDGAPK